MSKAQNWVIIFLSFLIVICLVVGGYIYSISIQVSNTLNAPAISTEFEITGDMLVTTDNNTLNLEYLRINQIKGKLNSRLIDLILMFTSDK